MMPESSRATVNSEVATGRRIKGADIFICLVPRLRSFDLICYAQTFNSPGQAVKVKIYHRSGKQRQHLTKDQPPNDGNTEGMPQFRSGSASKGQRNAAEHGCHGGHQNGSEAQQTCLMNRFERRLAFLALG